MNVAHAAPGEGDVFLTGASGFVGAHVLAALLGRGYRVRALVRGPLDAPPGVAAHHRRPAHSRRVDPRAPGVQLRGPHRGAVLLCAARPCRDRGGECARDGGNPRGRAHRRCGALRGDVELCRAATGAGVPPRDRERLGEWRSPWLVVPRVQARRGTCGTAARRSPSPLSCQLRRSVPAITARHRPARSSST